MVTKVPGEAETGCGGYTKEQLAAWGVPWPPPKGWEAEAHNLPSGACETRRAQPMLKDDFRATAVTFSERPRDAHVEASNCLHGLQRGCFPMPLDGTLASRTHDRIGPASRCRTRCTCWPYHP